MSNNTLRTPVPNTLIVISSVFVIVSHFHPSLIIAGGIYSKACSKPCQQISDKGRSDWQWHTLWLTAIQSKLRWETIQYMSRGLYFKALRICNLLKVDRLRTKLVCLSKPVKVTDNKKDTLAYYTTDLYTAVTTFILKVLRVDLIKLFCVNLLTLFCKLDLFIAMPQILLLFLKWSSLHKGWVKLLPNWF
jgi:hypothetical protein